MRKIQRAVEIERTHGTFESVDGASRKVENGGVQDRGVFALQEAHLTH